MVGYKVLADIIHDLAALGSVDSALLALSIKYISSVSMATGGMGAQKYGRDLLD